MKPNGWEKKKMLRDVDLVDEIINLRKRLAIAEAQRDNALSVVWDLRMDNLKMREALKQIIEPIGPSYPDSLIHNDLEIIEIAQSALKDGE